MSSVHTTQAFPIKHFDPNSGCRILLLEGRRGMYFLFRVIGVTSGSMGIKLPPESAQEDGVVAILRQLYDQKIGEVGCRWIGLDTPIEYKYAKIKFGDVFDFYTDSEGVLKFPAYVSFKYVVDQYLEEDPRVKYHPSRVRQFIDDNGIEQLDTME